MLCRSRIVLWAAVCAVGLCGSGTTAYGQEDATKQTPPGAPAVEVEQAPAAEEPARRPLMSLMDAAGVGGALDDAGINIYGHAEGSYTYNFQNPAGDVNVGRVFDFEHDELLLNQLDLTVQRTVDATAKSPDFGFTVEVIYGADARLTHANGLNFYGSSAPQLDPENQFDLVQAYVDIVPVQNITIRAGKMVTHMGYETINPTTNPLYSHAYLFGYAIPFTHTGVMVMWNATDKLTLMGGISRGWEQALEDDNDAIDYIGQVKYVFSDKLTGYFNFVVGPEKPDNDDDWRVVVDGILTYAATDRLTFAVNADYGWEENSAADGGDAAWYGVAGYAGYKFTDRLTLNSRAEWFNDDDAARGLGTDVYEATLGLTVTPFPNDRVGSNLKVRPELRYDYADDSIFDGGTENSQLTAAVDVIFLF